jgi:hypothetical protein
MYGEVGGVSWDFKFWISKLRNLLYSKIVYTEVNPITGHYRRIKISQFRNCSFPNATKATHKRTGPSKT